MELIISLHLICYQAKVTPGQPEHEIRYLESLDLESLEKDLIAQEEIYDPPGIFQDGVFYEFLSDDFSSEPNLDQFNQENVNPLKDIGFREILVQTLNSNFNENFTIFFPNHAIFDILAEENSQKLKNFNISFLCLEILHIICAEEIFKPDHYIFLNQKPLKATFSFKKFLLIFSKYYRPGSVSDRNKKSLFFLAKNHLLSLFRDSKKINFCLLGLDYLKLERSSEYFLKSENFTKEDNFITFYFLISKKLNRSNFHFFSCSFDLFLFEFSKSKNSIEFFSRQANRFGLRNIILFINSYRGKKSPEIVENNLNFFTPNEINISVKTFFLLINRFWVIEQRKIKKNLSLISDYAEALFILGYTSKCFFGMEEEDDVKFSTNLIIFVETSSFDPKFKLCPFNEY
jgi:hypothetical protein